MFLCIFMGLTILASQALIFIYTYKLNKVLCTVLATQSPFSKLLTIISTSNTATRLNHSLSTIIFYMTVSKTFGHFWAHFSLPTSSKKCLSRNDHNIFSVVWRLSGSGGRLLPLLLTLNIEYRHGWSRMSKKQLLAEEIWQFLYSSNTNSDQVWQPGLAVPIGREQEGFLNPIN
jgi:hypothetical protein